jgi:hypothetical protein
VTPPYSSSFPKERRHGASPRSGCVAFWPYTYITAGLMLLIAQSPGLALGCSHTRSEQLKKPSPHAPKPVLALESFTLRGGDGDYVFPLPTFFLEGRGRTSLPLTPQIPYHLP